jgi:fructoselysine-6-P-deglycase FrlB-like protein
MTYFSTELATQPSVWREARGVADELRSKLPADGSRLGIVGCGTSLYVAQAVASYRERQGAGETDAYPGSEVPPGRPWDHVIALALGHDDRDPRRDPRPSRRHPRPRHHRQPRLAGR